MNSSTLAAASSRAPRLREACCANARPASVGTTPRPARTNRSVPSAFSSLRICSATAGCETFSAAAAAVKEPSSTVAQKQRTCCSDKSSAFDSTRKESLARERFAADHPTHDAERYRRDARRRRHRRWDRGALGGVAAPPPRRPAARGRRSARRPHAVRSARRLLAQLRRASLPRARVAGRHDGA